MKHQWIPIYWTQNLSNAFLLKNVLEENDITCIVLNQQSSFYPMIGDIKILVKPENVIKGKRMLSKTGL